MAEIFLKIVNMSISATWIVLAVILIRLLLKKAPKWIAVLLWGFVAVRLVCPFSIESVLSLIPTTETISPEIMMQKEPQIDSGVPIVNTIVNPYIIESFAPNPGDSANPLQIIVPLLAIAWVLGVAGMLIYAVISYLRVKKKIGTAVLLKDNIYQSESVVSPFVLGIIKPKIYLPFNMANKDLGHVIAHENAHIRRKDHLWKPLGFLLLAVYWFNPLMWLGYILLCRDIELACDEKVIKELSSAQKADYSEALLSCSVNRRIIAACPLAFGEVGVKNRVKTVLNYKKPAFWIVVVAIITAAAVAVCFLTNPINKNDGNTNKPTSNTSENLKLESPEKSSNNPQSLNYDDFWNADAVNTPGLSIASVTSLRTLYPDLFNISTDGGLTVHIWQTSKDDYRCFLVNSASEAKRDNSFAYESGTTIPEMRTILSTYGIKKDNISIIPVKNPRYNYDYQIDAKYIEKVKKLFWEDENLIFSTVTSGYYGIEEIDFNAANEDKIESKESKCPVYKIDSFEKLEEFKTALLNAVKASRAYYPNISSFEVATKGFNSEYFDKNSLILTHVISGSGTYRFDVQRLEINNKSLNVHIVETTKAEVVTMDMAAWYVIVSVPKTLIKNCTEFDADVNDIAYLDKTIELKQKFPKYFGLDASNGLDLYFWKDSDNQNLCALLPTKDGGYSESELLSLTESGATAGEMKEIMRYYMKKQGVTRKTVTISFLKTPKSDLTDPDGALAKSFGYSFWFSGRNPLIY